MTTVQDIPEVKLLEYRMTLGMTTMEGRGFYAPTDVGIAEDGRMYVANRSLENVTRGVRVTMCDIDSEYYGTFAAYGQSPGQFIWPSACTLDSRGRVYVSDEATHRISVFDREGRCCPRGASTEPARGNWTRRRAWPSTPTTTSTSPTPTTTGCRNSLPTDDSSWPSARGQRAGRVQPPLGHHRGRRRLHVRRRLGQRPHPEVRR